MGTSSPDLATRTQLSFSAVASMLSGSYDVGLAAARTRVTRSTTSGSTCAACNVETRCSVTRW